MRARQTSAVCLLFPAKRRQNRHDTKNPHWGFRVLYNRKARDFHLAKLEAADSAYWSQIAAGASAIELMRRTFQTPSTPNRPGKFLIWNDFVAWKRRSINFRTVRVGMAMTELRQAEKRGDKAAIRSARTSLKALRVCPNDRCYHFGHSFQADTCERCGTMLSGGGDDESLTVKTEPRAIVQRLLSIPEYKTLQQAGVVLTATVRPRGAEVVIAETDSLTSDLVLLLALRGIATPQHKLLGGYTL